MTAKKSPLNAGNTPLVLGSVFLGAGLIFLLRSRSQGPVSYGPALTVFPSTEADSSNLTNALNTIHALGHMGGIAHNLPPGGSGSSGGSQGGSTTPPPSQTGPGPIVNPPPPATNPALDFVPPPNTVPYPLYPGNIPAVFNPATGVLTDRYGSLPTRGYNNATGRYGYTGAGSANWAANAGWSAEQLGNEFYRGDTAAGQAILNTVAKDNATVNQYAQGIASGQYGKSNPAYSGLSAVDQAQALVVAAQQNGSYDPWHDYSKDI